MLNKSYVTSLIILSSMLISSLFFYWSLFMIYDAKALEKQGHVNYANKNYQKAYDYFYRTAIISTDMMNKKQDNTPSTHSTKSEREKLSARYRFAASAAHANKDYPNTHLMIKKSLSYNSKNKAALSLQRHMQVNKQ